MPLSHAVLLAWAAMACMMAVAYLTARRLENYGLVDVAWAAGLGILAAGYGAAGAGLPGRRLVVALMGGLWAGRLAWYLYTNRVRGKPEDGRYAELRRRWGDGARWKLFLFFQVQATWDVLFSLPFAAAAWNRAPLGVLDAVGVVVWLVAVLGETTADRQLAAFRADDANRGRTCAVGLWRYSRHPNYFFEWTHWFAYPCLAWSSPFLWLAVAGPFVMALFLFKITGIPHTEQQALRTRGDDYRRYQRRTSMFVPWFPKEDDHAPVA